MKKIKIVDTLISGIFLFLSIGLVNALPNNENELADSLWIGFLKLLSQIWLPLIFLLGTIILVFSIVLLFRILGNIIGGRR